ncbi:MAG TPA: FAD-dependent oxidoreductase [Bacillota bacterium]|nr:FAD-dependent oxidoreductase [Bacillota bacterium]
MTRYLIVGLNVAGIAAMKAIRELDRAGRIVAVSGESHLPYSRVLLPRYLAGGAVREEMSLEPADFYRAEGTRVIWGRRVVALDHERREAALDDGTTIDFDRALIAAGGSPIIPGHLAGPGVTGLRTLEDAVLIRERASAGTRVCIGGAGPVGVKTACALAELGVRPALIVASGRILSQIADPEAASLAQRRLELHGVEVRLGTDISRALRGRAGLEALQLSDGTAVPCGLLVLCKGVTPNVAGMPSAVHGRSGIAVDGMMATRMSGLYAAGDAAETRDLIDGQTKVTAIFPNAAAQGRIAGKNMAGATAVFDGSLPRNALDLLGLPLISIGLVAAGLDARHAVRATRTAGSYRKLVYRDGLLVGALLVGEVMDAGVLQARIRRNLAGSPGLREPGQLMGEAG